ncbi:MAG: hypothetical protein RL199_1262 [Pseudomonadota bacterium]|jgi:competence protein ComEC
MSDQPQTFLRPGLWAGLAVATGAAAGVELPSTRLASLGGVLCFALALLLVRGRAVRTAALCAFVAVGLLSGSAAPRPADVSLLNAVLDDGRPVRFTGRLVEPVQHKLAPPRWRSETDQARLSLVVDVDQVQWDGAWRPLGARAVLGGEDVPLAVHAGDGVEGVARFVMPPAPQNPGQDDTRARLRRRGIALAGALERGALAAIAPSHGFAARAERFRVSFDAFVRARVGDPDRASLVSALSVGERGGVSSELSNAFNASGLAHVLSISGLHLAVAVLAFAWLLRRLFGLSGWLSACIAPKSLSALVSLPVSALYVALIGAPPPALRAGLGTGLLLAGRASGRATDALNTLGWTLAVVAAADPASLFEPSTQLSFLGVWGLAWVSPRLRELIPIAPPEADAHWTLRFGETLLTMAVGTLSATLATAPVTAAFFERVSFVAVVANIAAWPASTLIVPAGALAAAVFPWWPSAAGVLVDVAGACAWLLAACARWFAAWPLASVVVPPPSVLSMIGWGLLLVGVLSLKRWARPMAASVAAAGLVLLAVAAWPASSADGKLTVTFLSVGQGDATFIRFPEGKTMLVDAGGEASMRFDPGARVVAPFLRSQGVRRLDVVAASHPHPDHIGGLPAIVERFDVGELWHDGLYVDDGPQGALLALARKAGVRIVDFKQGLPAACPRETPLGELLPAVADMNVGDPRCRPAPPARDFDGVKVEVLHPLNGPDSSAYPELGENDNSLVLRLTYGEVRVLLSGDLEHEGEAILRASPYDLEADILKAPHHGSRTSSTADFVARVKPRHVVFCVGKNNMFGFPKADVVARYEGAGCRRYRTDEGAVTFATDGRSIDVQPFEASAAVVPSGDGR